MQFTQTFCRDSMMTVLPLNSIHISSRTISHIQKASDLEETLTRIGFQQNQEHKERWYSTSVDIEVVIYCLDKVFLLKKQRELLPIDSSAQKLLASLSSVV